MFFKIRLMYAFTGYINKRKTMLIARVLLCKAKHSKSEILY